MDDIVFTPRYRYHPIFTAFVCALIAGIGITLMIDQGFRIELALFTLVILGTLLSLPRSYFRRLTFGSAGLTVSRYFLPDEHFEYAEISQLGQNAIVTTRGKISLFAAQNSGELIRIQEILLTRGWLTPGMATIGPEFNYESILKTARWAVIPAIIFWSIFLFAFQLAIDSPVSWLAFPVIQIVVMIAIFLVRSRSTA